MYYVMYVHVHVMCVNELPIRNTCVCLVFGCVCICFCVCACACVHECMSCMIIAYRLPLISVDTCSMFCIQGIYLQDGKHEAIVKNIHDLLARLAWDFSPEQLDHLFGCFQVCVEIIIEHMSS